MADVDFEKGSSGVRGEDLECDGSELDLVDRFKSIRCNSGKSSEIILVEGEAIRCVFGDDPKPSLGSLECRTEANDDKSFCSHAVNRRMSTAVKEKCNGTEERRTKQESTCDVTGGILNDSSSSVSVQVTSGSRPTSTEATVDINFDKSRHIDLKLREQKQLKWGYWKIILKPDKDGDNLIFIAILLDKFNLCFQMLTLIPSQVLISARQNNMYQTALHLAALVDNAKLVRRFLVAGVQVDKQDKFGNTALHIACKRGNIAVAEALLYPVRYVETRQNAYDISYQRIPQNLEIRNYEGQTCLMIAASNSDTAMMDLLISKHADIKVKDIKSGMTCLHVATESGNVDIVQYLLKRNKTDINAKTYSGFTALDIANIRGQSYIAYMLLCAGAKPELKPMNSADFLAESDCDDKDSD